MKIRASTGYRNPCPLAIAAAMIPHAIAANMLVNRTASNPPSVAGIENSAVQSGRPQISTKNIGCSNACLAKIKCVAPSDSMNPRDLTAAAAEQTANAEIAISAVR